MLHKRCYHLRIGVTLVVRFLYISFDNNLLDVSTPCTTLHAFS